MARGPAPQPAKLIALKGTGNATRQKERTTGQPEPKADKVAKPKGLSRLASAQWDRVAPDLLAAGLLTNPDVEALRMYCEAFARWKQANLKIGKEGAVIQNQHGVPTVSPWVKISEAAFREMKSILTEFGMTPSSRNRVKADTGDDDDEGASADPWSKFK
ncbi:phage terminase small subunit P27 family [Salipiger pacificus]|nr:phage terminase small subunit P27 family [Alloyangia pacifica]